MLVALSNCNCAAVPPSIRLINANTLIAQGSGCRLGTVGQIGFLYLILRIQAWQYILQMLRKAKCQRLTGLPDRMGIRDVALAVQGGGNVIFAGQRQRQCPKTGIQSVVPRDRQQGIQKRRFLAGCHQ